MNQEFLKITFHSGAKKINAYLEKPSYNYFSLKKQIAGWVFEERQLPHCEIRIFWIDDSGDEIEVINDNDVYAFYANCLERQHLHIAPVTLAGEEPTAAASKPSVTFSESASKAGQIPPVDSSYDFAVHDHVECDACLMEPIVGFRYKCIQCPNYDLCQNCETKHIHSEHMMVRMPNNNCPNIIEAYVTGRASGRKHGKRSKTSCPFVRHGISVVIDDDIEARNSAGGENAEQSSANRKEHHYGRKHRRHHRNNFFSHLYEMMHDLAEGGGPDAAAHAMDESSISSKTTTSTTGPQKTTTTTTTTTTSNGTGFGKEENPIATAAAAVAQIAAKQAHEAATKAIADGFGNKDNPIAAAAASAAQMAAKQAHEAASKANATGFGNKENPMSGAAAAIAQMAAKQAHEAAAKAALTAVKAAHENVLKTNKNMSENTTTSDATSAATNNKREKETINEKIDATTSPNDLEPQPDSVPVIPTPSLESFVQFLDPNFMKTGVQILNNFSDMFAKMLDPMEESGNAKTQNNANSRKNSTTSTKSSVSSSINSMGDAKNIDEEKSLEKNETQEKTEENKQSDSDISHVEIYDLGSDSENESVSETFVKLYAPKKGDVAAPTSAKPTTEFTSAQTTPPQSLEKSTAMDYAQLGAALKSHIAKETQKDSIKSTETTAESIEKANEAIDTITSTISSNDPVVTTSTPTKPEEKRAVLVYHADQRINNAVHAMMAMGFSNEGAWLTQLLESVNGNISDALDLMSAAQLNGNR